MFRKKLRTLRSNSNEVDNSKTKTTRIKKLKVKNSNKFDEMMENDDIKNSVLPTEDEEDAEIRRLEKLLAIDASGVDKKRKRKSAAEKLNKEFAEFEGITGNFGDFLMDLDQIGKRELKEPLNNQDEVNTNEENQFEDVIDFQDNFEDEVSEDNFETYNENDDEDDENDEDIAEENEKDKVQSKNTYRPVAGEDIYGRLIEGSESGEKSAKYVPPARRRLVVPDMDSESAVVLKRTVTGLLNRLSAQSRDTVVRSLKKLYDSNSINLMNSIMKDCTLTVCASSAQTMVTMIPVYAAVIAVLHIAVSKEVGAFLIEQLVALMFDNSKERKEGSEKNEAGNKNIHNYFLILIYFYNLKVLHHQLVVDIANRICDDLLSNVGSEKNSGWDIDLISLLMDHCGFQLRKDDPQSFKNIITSMSSYLSKLSQHSLESGETHEDISRLKFILEVINEAGASGKSQRVSNKHMDEIKSLRKWIGNVKGGLLATSSANGAAGLSHGQSATQGDTCLRVSLNDILQADNKGRWWKLGASWKKNESASNQLLGFSDSSEEAQQKRLKSSSNSNLSTSETVHSKEEEMLLKLATKLKFNTATRRSIFLVVMSSRDIDDAFERLSRLDMRGSEDREVVRVVMECCAQESNYNQFYAELVATLCKSNRQYKTTTLYAFWDFFRNLDEEKDMKHKKIANLARLLSHMICSFDVSISIIKRIEMSEISQNMILFLSSLFLSLFSSEIEDDNFEKIFDRIATTDDFQIARDNIVFFLQNYLKSLPHEVKDMDREKIKKRKKKALRIMESMDVLAIAKAQSEKKKSSKSEREE